MWKSTTFTNFYIGIKESISLLLRGVSRGLVPFREHPRGGGPLVTFHTQVWWSWDQVHMKEHQNALVWCQQAIFKCGDVVPPRQLHAMSALKLPILHYKVHQLWQLRRQVNFHWTELAVGSNESHWCQLSDDMLVDTIQAIHQQCNPIWQAPLFLTCNCPLHCLGRLKKSFLSHHLESHLHVRL